MSSDLNQSERFFVPASVIRLLVAITLPTRSDKILNINLDPSILTPEMKNKVDQDPDYVKTNPAPEDLEKLEQIYDIILCGPTFGIPAEQFPGGNGEPSEEFWLKWGIHHLSKNGRFAVLVPNGLLANYSQQNFRRFLLEQCDILAILELPLGWSQGTNVQASILLITPSRNPVRTVKMFRFSKFETIPWDAVASSVLTQDGIVSHKTFTSFFVKAPQLGPERLDASYYDPKHLRIPVPDPNFFKAVPLGELVRIDGGERLSESVFASFGIPYIQVANVGSDGHLYLRDTKLADPEKVKLSKKASPLHYHCIRGDLIITVAGTVGKVTLIDDKLPSYGVYINTSSRRLRVKDNNVVLPEYLFIHLRSEIIQQQIARFRSGSVIPVLSIADLGKITLYIPPLDKQQELISSLRDTTLKHAKKALSHFYGIEKEQSAVDVQKSNTKAPTVPQPPIEEFVKNQFPFPIARAFRILQQSERREYTQQLSELIAVSESIIYYLSAICIVDQVSRLKIANEALLTSIRNSFSDRSMKNRIEIISTIQRFAKQDTSIRLFVPEIVNAAIGICKGIQGQTRNEKSHTQPKTEYECRGLMKKLRPEIGHLLESLLFLKDYKLVLVTPSAYRNGRHVYKFEYLMGDNDVFELAEADLENALSVETDHVLLMNSRAEFLDLHPFYLFHGWESTGKKEHLCFFKYYSEPSKRDSSKKRLIIESTLRAGEHDIDDDGLEVFLKGLPTL